MDHGVVGLAEVATMSASEAHRARLAPYVDPHLARRGAGIAHPVHDFLFTYYSHPPAKLLDWQPGWPATGTRELLDKRRPLVASTLELLRATASRPPTLSCFGLHEWAMVHGADRTRHPAPLRLGGAGTDQVVEAHRISCSHFDAFRFFTPTAAPQNQLRPGRDDRASFEQPGCLHATMDLYKHAFRLWPLVGSDLVADCFVLAWDLRVVDMRAAPYDLTGTILDPTGEEWTPIRIETAEGKQEYAAHQREFADRAAPLRAELIRWCEDLATVGPMDDRVLQNFLAADGRLTTIPTKHSKLLVVLDHLSQQFEPGQTYPEAEVNQILQRFHPDFAALRRYLVEDGFMTREDNTYWRSGGTFDV